MDKEDLNATTMIKEHDTEDISSLENLSRTERAAIARDTVNILQTGCYTSSQHSTINIADDVGFSVNNTIIYKEEDLENTKTLISNNDVPGSELNIEFRLCTTLQAARSLSSQVNNEHIGVLNFASAKNPGGGFLNGSNAQEESLARSSSLYSTLIQTRIFNQFYDYNRHGRNPIYSHRIIYSPRVTVFKDDNGNLLSSPYQISIVTIPAPNASVVQRVELVKSVMFERIRRLLEVFKMNRHDTLVLGAFGCGVFKNNPLDVATMFRQHLQSDEFKNSFQRIIFAILDPKMCQIFKDVFNHNDFNPKQLNFSHSHLNYNINQNVIHNNRNKDKNKHRKQRKSNNRFQPVDVKDNND